MSGFTDLARRLTDRGYDAYTVKADISRGGLGTVSVSAVCPHRRRLRN